jgi:dihydroxyacetone kinase-like predicted kinase
VNISRARELAGAALANLEIHRRRIDDLNVYPVPDGDTGTNLTLTGRAVVEALAASTAEGPEAVAKELSRAALMGARGNSGVIFSQILRGFADVLGRHEEIDGEVLAAAFRSASDAAYRAVRRPVEGTMLTVVREMAEEAELPEVRTLPNEEVLARVVTRGEDALARTPGMLAVLAQAGVVDAGGAGLLEIVRGIAAAVAGGAAARGSCPDRGARLRGRSPGAVAVPLLHRVRRRGRGAGPRVHRARARTPRRLATRRR